MKPSTKLTLCVWPFALAAYLFGIWLSGWEPERGRGAAWLFIYGVWGAASVWWGCLVAKVPEDIDYEDAQRKR